MKNINRCPLGKKMKIMPLYCILYSMVPLVDSLNGFVITTLNSNISVGQIYRLLLVATIFVMALYTKVNLKDLRPLLIVSIMLLVPSLIHLLLGGNVSDEFMNLFQWLLFPIFIFGFNVLSAHGRMFEEDRKLILEIWRWLFPLTILIPKLLDVGYYTYGADIGYKGFYYANNGVSFALSILLIYSLYSFYFNLSIKNGINFALCAWACLTIGTKSCMLSIVVAVLFLLFDKSTWKYFRRLVLFSAILIIAVFVFRSFIVEKINVVLSRYKYFSRVLDNVFIDSITTGRTGKLEELWAEVKSGGVVRCFFGLGNINYVAEMDFFDLFFQFGIMGVVAFIVYAFKLRKGTIKTAGIYRRLFIFSMVYAFVVGHVFNNALSTMVLALVFVSLPKRDVVYEKKSIKIDLNRNSYVSRKEDKYRSLCG